MRDWKPLANPIIIPKELGFIKESLIIIGNFLNGPLFSEIDIGKFNKKIRMLN